MDEFLRIPPDELVHMKLDEIVNQFLTNPSLPPTAMGAGEQNPHPQAHPRQDIRLGRVEMYFDAPWSVQQQHAHQHQQQQLQLQLQLQQQQYPGYWPWRGGGGGVQHYEHYPVPTPTGQYLPENGTATLPKGQQESPDPILTQEAYDDLLHGPRLGISQQVCCLTRESLQSKYMHSSYTQPLNDKNDPAIPMPPGNFALGAATAALVTPAYELEASIGVREKGGAGVGNNSDNPALVEFKCRHPECKRTKGFTRKHNLLQHRRMVHKEEIPIVRYRWGVPPEGDSGRKTQRRRRRGAAMENQ